MSEVPKPDLGDLPLALQSLAPPVPPSPGVSPTAPVAPAPPSPPPLPLKPVKHTSPLIPLLLGGLLMLIGVVLAGVLYYFRFLRAPTSTALASPSPSAIVPAVSENFTSPSPELSAELTASQDAQLTRALASPTPSIQPKILSSSAKPSSSPLPSPTSPSPAPRATLDLTFGNPSATGEESVMQDGTRVRYRSFTSIESAIFIALSSGDPKLSVCFQVTSTEKIAGSRVKYVYVVDGTTVQDADLSSYGDIEPNRSYSLCRDTSLTPGSHSVSLELNKVHTESEANYTNNFARFDYTVASETQ